MLALLALLAPVALPATVASAGVLVPRGFVAVTNGEGSLQISEFKLDGTPVRRLTSGPANHNFPSVSPDGAKMVYMGDEGGLAEIYARPLVTGGTPTQLTHAPLTATSPNWSADGKRIVYSALRPGSPAYQIFVSAADGSNPIQLTDTMDSGNTQPVFSPDGSRIAYINGRRVPATGVFGAPSTVFTNQLWMMAADGSGAAALTDGTRDAYPEWLNQTTVMFAREDAASGTSTILSTTVDGQLRNQSFSLHLIEPRPLPDGRSYGATAEDQSGLHLVRVSRADGAALTARSASDFRVQRLGLPSAEGSAFTMSWVLGDVADPGRPQPWVAIFALCAVGLAALVALAGTIKVRNNRN
jgi:hypothetical protein